ncbi:MAG: hypothetical protein C6W56_10470 [Caldibacillus debilis]|nr:MAG: hypothetical protein C6W56_10470 [Caldibacillus debilis]
MEAGEFFPGGRLPGRRLPQGKMRPGRWTMGLFDFFGGRCAICKRKISPLRKSIDPRGKTVKICRACAEYAERGAYQIH